ncbi:MAG: hypothetical protein CMF29_08445 [Kiritimatiellaceae bacterium]|jgi:hypothetical protein|nr:hypothetical protein [Kiritimatiellaceae bacterium]
MIERMIEMLQAIVIALLFSWVAINWVTGCGTYDRTIDGKIIWGHCVLVPFVTERVIDFQ